MFILSIIVRLFNVCEALQSLNIHVRSNSALQCNCRIIILFLSKNSNAKDKKICQQKMLNNVT